CRRTVSAADPPASGGRVRRDTRQGGGWRNRLARPASAHRVEGWRIPGVGGHRTGHLRAPTPGGVAARSKEPPGARGAGEAASRYTRYDRQLSRGTDGELCRRAGRARSRWKAAAATHFAGTVEG